MKSSKSSIKHFDEFAEDYDKLAKSEEHNWLSPDVIFGLVFEYLKGRKKLLDIGIGTGLSALSFYNYGFKIYGVDGSAKMLEKCKAKNIAKILKKINLDDGKIPFEDDMFDVAIADGILYFLRNPEHIIKEASRVLKNKCIFAFTIEERKGNEEIEYVNIDNDLISKSILEKTGVLVYRHDFDKIERTLSKNRFKILKKLNFHAYKSPSTKKDVYFTAIVAEKINK